MGVVDPDRSSIEVKALLRRLHPKAGNHKDRVRRISKFRNYINGDSKNTPEFYDDDVPLLLLGSVTPSALLEEDDEAFSEIYGLMQACGSPSSEHDKALKRSARHSVMLLKYLVTEYTEMENGVRINNTSIDDNNPDGLPVPRNVFAHAFCSLAVRHYKLLELGLHIREGNNRGAAKEEACQIMVLLLTQHYSEDGQSMAPLLLDDLVSHPPHQQAFELWAHTSTTREQQEKMKENALKRQNEIALRERKEQLQNKGLSRISEEFELDNDDDQDEHSENEDSDGSDSDFDENDAMAVMLRRQKQMKKELKKAKKDGERAALEGPAMRWEDSQLYREQQARAAANQRAAETGQHHETVRESQDAIQELAVREEEKAKILGRDPLGLLGDDFDLRKIQDAQAEYMEQTLQGLEEGMHKAERENTIEDSKSNSAEDDFKRQQAQKESLMAIVDRLGGLDQLENPTRSVLPTDPTFDPMLFLTLVHREVGYRELIGSVDRLTNKTTNQHKQLQNLVRENFPLFVRCAEGIDAFNEKTGSQEGPGVNERIDKLETLAEKCAHQAKKSFKPLLDNASEVRKVQSSLSVLNRVAPILQAPFLMRQHVENRRYSQALKAYRRVLVIDKNCTIELLNHVKQQAIKYLHETRWDLERCLAQDKASVDELLHGIRDLSELLELDVPIIAREEDDDADKVDEYRISDGVYDIAGRIIKMREHPPATSCLHLQVAHFTRIVNKAIHDADNTIRRIYGGETLQQVQASNAAEGGTENDVTPSKNSGNSGNQWKYDVMDARVLGAVKSVEIARNWLPRLLRISKTAREDEKRRSARIASARRQSIAFHRTQPSGAQFDHNASAFDLFRQHIVPVVTRLVEHATFCSLGCPARSGGSELNMSFGEDSPEKLRTLLRGALPPSHGTRVGTELAEMVELLSESSSGANGLRAAADGTVEGLSPLDECKTLGESAVITLEKRRCIIAFEVCARTCSNRASGSGKFDAEALLQTLRTLSEQLTRPEECSVEVENGCELVVQRCCEGLASYVRDRSGDSARLSAVAECADVMENRVGEIVKEVENLTSNAAAVEEVIMEDIMGLEGAMFDEYLESIREHVANSVRVGWLDMDNEGISANHDRGGASFPSYLSSSLLSIVRCRAQVEQALGGKIRRSDGVTYQHLSMATVADGVVEGICHAVEMRRNRLKVRQADRLANELQFLLNTLRKFLSDGSMSVLDSTRIMLCTKAGRGSGFTGDGPDGLAALESLERLGRVYVLCLGE